MATTNPTVDRSIRPLCVPLARRTFLRQIAAAAAGIALRPDRLLAANPPRIRPIGFSLYGMQMLPIGTAITECARIGYECVELSLLTESPTALEKFTPPLRRDVAMRLRDHRLELSALLVNLDLTVTDITPACDVVRRAADIARDLNGAQPPLIESVCGGRQQDWHQQKERIAANARQLASALANSGVKLALKAHCDQAVNTPERLLWLRQQVNLPAITLTYDYSHYQAEGFGLEESMRAIVPLAEFIHVKDVAVGRRPVEFLLVGEGSINYATYFRLLRQLNYAGPVVAEVSAQIFRRPGYAPLKAAERCYAVLSRARAAAIAAP